jgi:tetratricopeptide (TPR) repeat protein
MVKQYSKDGVRHVVFRVFTGENLNYHDFELVKRGGTIKAADLYVYALGQHFSATMLETIGIIDEMPSSSASEAKEFANNVKTMMGHVRSGEVEKAAKIYDNMPDGLKKQRIIQMVNLQICMGLSDEKYMDAIREFQELFPDSPNMYLLLIDEYFFKEDYKNALVNVNQLDSIINRDPFLDYYRSIIYEKLEDQENRQKSLEQLHQSMPDFVDGNINLINFYLETEDDEKAVTLTEELIRTKKIKESDLESLFLLYPDYKKKLKI